MNILLTLIKKELIQTLRDKKFRFILFAAPVIQLIVFGYVVTTDIRDIPLAIIDYDQSSASREFSASFISSGYFKEVKMRQPSTYSALEYLNMNKVKVVFVMPPDFSQNIERGITANIQMLIDGTDANSAVITRGYLEDIVRNYSVDIVNHKQALSGTLGRSLASAVVPEIRILYNPEMKSSHYMIPGLLCMILLIITALLTAMAITREKELGTLEQIIVSPLARWQFILGKTLPYVLVGFIDIILVLATGKIIFAIPLRGNLLFLFLSAIIFLFTTLGLGLLAASVSKNQAQAMLTVFPIMMPAFLLSGLIFPVNSIPLGLRWIAYINPLTYYLIVVRGILIKGAGLFELYREVLVLLGFGIAFITYSSLRFRKRM